MNAESEGESQILAALTQNSNLQRGVATLSISYAIVQTAPYSTRKFWRHFSKHFVDTVVCSHTKVFCSIKCYRPDLEGNLLQRTISLAMLTEINLVIKIKYPSKLLKLFSITELFPFKLLIPQSKEKAAIRQFRNSGVAISHLLLCSTQFYRSTPKDRKGHVFSRIFIVG